ncbi:MAG: hypothetical protein E6R11_02030 [Rhodocyclaceae bacterium]|nr:MAG: hypothetical protein E6R11_02030 [Rhodocyclaceae bacterium]
MLFGLRGRIEHHRFTGPFSHCACRVRVDRDQHLGNGLRNQLGWDSNCDTDALEAVSDDAKRSVAGDSSGGWRSFKLGARKMRSTNMQLRLHPHA